MSLPCFAHVLYYKADRGECYVVRILHERRDVQRAFDASGRGASRVKEQLAVYAPVALMSC